MSQRYSVRIEGEAEDDLYGIVRYIAGTLREPGTAAKVYHRIKRAITELDHMPERIMCLKNEPWHSRGLRKLIIGNYVAIFLVDGDTVHVLRIFYGGMDIDKQLEERPE